MSGLGPSVAYAWMKAECLMSIRMNNIHGNDMAQRDFEIPMDSILRIHHEMLINDGL